jgi:hypothetical protein
MKAHASRSNDSTEKIISADCRYLSNNKIDGAHQLQNITAGWRVQTVLLTLPHCAPSRHTAHLGPEWDLCTFDRTVSGGGCMSHLQNVLQGKVHCFRPSHTLYPASGWLPLLLNCAVQVSLQQQTVW